MQPRMWRHASAFAVAALASALVSVAARADEASPAGDAAPAPAPAITPSIAPAPAAPAEPLRAYALAAIGVPRVIGVAAGVRFRGRFAAELELMGLPRGLAEFGEDSRTTKAATASQIAVSANGAWFPLRVVPIYAGLGLGYQSATSTTRNFGSHVAYTSSSFTLTPRVGVEFLVRNRVLIGGAIGIPALLGVETELDSDGQTSGNARKVAKTFGAPIEERLSLFGFPFVVIRGGVVF
jgi:hypothetical protein